MKKQTRFWKMGRFVQGVQVVEAIWRGKKVWLILEKFINIFVLSGSHFQHNKKLLPIRLPCPSKLNLTAGWEYSFRYFQASAFLILLVYQMLCQLKWTWKWKNWICDSWYSHVHFLQWHTHTWNFIIAKEPEVFHSILM